MDLEELKKKIEELAKAHAEFIKKNDQRLAEVEKKGHADPLLTDQVNKIAAELQNLTEMKERLEQVEIKIQRPGMEDKPPQEQEDAERKQAILKYIRKGEGAMTPDEVKLLSVDSDPDGGYYVTPEMSSQVITQIFETSPFRNVATVENISTDALEIPDDLNEADGAWSGERVVPAETGTPKVGVRRIPVYWLYAMPKATQQLLDDANINVEAWLARKVADKLSRLENTAFINGNGADRPRGILTYPAGTTNPGQIEQINSGSAAALTADGLRKLFYALKSPYINRARWLMARSSIEKISLLKDSQNQYLWQPGLQQGEPQMLLGHPIDRMEDMPAVVADSLSITFGDFREGYTIVDRMGLRILRDPFTGKPFVLFYTTKRTGGDVTNFEAFKIQKTAA